MRRALERLALVLIGVVLALPGPSVGHRRHETPRCDLGVTANSGTARIEKMVRCAGRVVPGVTPATMVRMGRCESGLNPWAVSPSGTYKGLYQYRSWHKAARLHGFPGHPWHDPVAQALTTAFIIRDSGTGAWPECGD